MASPETLSPTPPEGSLHRPLYERAYRKNNHLLRASASLDHRIDTLQRTISTQRPIDIAHEINCMELAALTSLHDADQNAQGVWTDYFRLMSQYRFLEQRIAVPLVFHGGAEKYAAMHHFVDGIYGISGDILFQAIQEYDRTTSDSEHSALAGVISEQTALALLNRDEHPRHFALPSSTYDDLYRRTDIEYWRLNTEKGNEQIEHIPIQVKTRLSKLSLGSVTPKKPHGIVIDASDMANGNNFHTASLIIRELGYQRDGDDRCHLSHDEKQELETIHTAFATTVDKRYAATKERSRYEQAISPSHMKNPFAGILPLIQRTH